MLISRSNNSLHAHASPTCLLTAHGLHFTHGHTHAIVSLCLNQTGVLRQQLTHTHTHLLDSDDIFKRNTDDRSSSEWILNSHTCLSENSHDKSAMRFCFVFFCFFYRHKPVSLHSHFYQELCDLAISDAPAQPEMCDCITLRTPGWVDAAKHAEHAAYAPLSHGAVPPNRMR